MSIISRCAISAGRPIPLRGICTTGRLNLGRLERSLAFNRRLSDNRGPGHDFPPVGRNGPPSGRDAPSPGRDGPPWGQRKRGPEDGPEATKGPVYARRMTIGDWVTLFLSLHGVWRAVKEPKDDQKGQASSAHVDDASDDDSPVWHTPSGAWMYSFVDSTVRTHLADSRSHVFVVVADANAVGPLRDIIRGDSTIRSQVDQLWIGTDIQKGVDRADEALRQDEGPQGVDARVFFASQKGGGMQVDDVELSEIFSRRGHIIGEKYGADYCYSLRNISVVAADGRVVPLHHLPSEQVKGLLQDVPIMMKRGEVVNLQLEMKELASSLGKGFACGLASAGAVMFSGIGRRPIAAFCLLSGLGYDVWAAGISHQAKREEYFLVLPRRTHSCLWEQVYNPSTQVREHVLKQYGYRIGRK